MEKLEHVFMNRAVFSVSLSDVLKNSSSRFSAISMASLAATFLRGTRQHYYESYIVLQSSVCSSFWYLSGFDPRKSVGPEIRADIRR